MFIEVNTIWKNIPPENFSVNNSPLHDIPARIEEELGKWGRRKVGVLFSKQNGIWTFIVLIAPEKEGLKVDGNGENVEQRDRGFLHLQVDENPGHRIANAHWRNGELAYCKDAQHRSEDMINYIAAQLREQGPRFLEWLARDVFWGWEEFLKEMRLAILQVISLRRFSF